MDGDENICHFWRNHYKELLNCGNSTVNEPYVREYLQNNTKVQDFQFTHKDIQSAISKLKNNKSAGLDNLHGEHYKHAGACLSTLLCKLFNSIPNQGYIPEDLMSTVIIPISKDKKESITSKDNYRPIALTTAASKILELAILDKIEDNLITGQNQFGYKKKHGTDTCVFTLKQIIEVYRAKSSPVYVCFLDASKAFDRINHWNLFTKLIKRNIHYKIINLLVYWYGQQICCVKWGAFVSKTFQVTSGVRQGGILSPRLFSIYIDDLSPVLNKTKVGCSVEGIISNHLMYADDTCLIGPSPCAIQKLLDICSKFAGENDIIFNESKTWLMCFKPKCYSNLYIPDLLLNGKVISHRQKHLYLGIMLDDKLNDELDLKRHENSLNRRGNVLVSHFKDCSTEVKDYLFKTHFLNAYGCQLWTTYRNPVMTRISVPYYDVYRWLFKIRRGVSISAIFVSKGIDSFNVLRRKLIYSFMQRIHTSENPLIQAIVQRSKFEESVVNREWTKALYMRHE